MEYTEQDHLDYADLMSVIRRENESEVSVVKAQLKRFNEVKKKRLKYLFLQDIYAFYRKVKETCAYQEDTTAVISDRVAAVEQTIRASVTFDQSINYMLTGLTEYLGTDSAFNTELFVLIDKLMYQLNKWISLCYRDVLEKGIVLYVPSLAQNINQDIRTFTQLAIFSY